MLFLIKFHVCKSINGKGQGIPQWLTSAPYQMGDTNLNNASLVAQRVKCLPTMRETWVRSLGQKDPLEKEMATHSSTLAWKIPWTEEPGRLQSMGVARAGHNVMTKPPLTKWEQAKAIYSELDTVRKSVTITCVWLRLKGRGVEILYSEKEEDSSYTVIGGYWHEEARGGLTRNRHPVWLVSGTYLISLVGPKLEVSLVGLKMR